MRNQPVILRLKSLGITGFFIFTSSLDFKDCISKSNNETQIIFTGWASAITSL